MNVSKDLINKQRHASLHWNALTLPLVRNQDVVDASEFDVDLEAEVGQCLRRGLDYVLHLDTLSGHAEQGVSNPLHLSCG